MQIRRVSESAPVLDRTFGKPADRHHLTIGPYANLIIKFEILIKRKLELERRRFNQRSENFSDLRRIREDGGLLPTVERAFGNRHRLHRAVNVAFAIRLEIGAPECSPAA